MNIVNKIIFPFAAIEYLTYALNQVPISGADVTQALLNGSLSALVPDSTPDDRVYEFKRGGILGPIDLSVVEQKTVQPVANTAN